MNIGELEILINNVNESMETLMDIILYMKMVVKWSLSYIFKKQKMENMKLL